MADGIKIKISGVRQTRRNIRRFALISRFELTDAVDRTLLRMVAKAKKIAPFKTARLARSITHKITNSTDQLIRGVFGANTVYARILELGNKKHRSKRSLRGRPTRYLFPAAQANFKNAVKEMSKALKIAMKKVKQGPS